MLIPICAGLLLPALAKAKGKALNVACTSNVRQLNLGLIMHAGDNGEAFPPADRWCDAIKQYVVNEKPFQCATQPDQRSSYALKAKIAGKKTTDIKEPARTVLVFGCAGGWNKAGGPELASAHPHSQGRVMVGFADGHTEVLSTNQLASLVWEP